MLLYWIYSDEKKKKNVIITGHVYDDTIKKLIKLKLVKKKIAYIYIVKKIWIYLILALFYYNIVNKIKFCFPRLLSFYINEMMKSLFRVKSLVVHRGGWD